MRKIILGTVLGLVFSIGAYTSAEAGNGFTAAPPPVCAQSGNNGTNPDTGGAVTGNYQYVSTDALGNVVEVSFTTPTNFPFGGNRWSNNGAWGSVVVGGKIISAGGNYYYPPGCEAPTSAPTEIATAVAPPTSVPIWAPTQELQQPAPAATQTVPAETPVVPQPVTTQTPVVSQPTPATTQFTQAPTSTPVVVAVATAAPTQLPTVDVVTVVGTASTSISSVSVTQKTQEEQKTLETQKDEGEWQPKRRSLFSGEQQAI